MEDNKEIKKFNPEDLIEKLRERTKASIIELVPDEQWQSMTENMVNQFMKGTEMPDGSHTPDKDTEYGKMVFKIWEEVMQEKTKAYLQEMCNGMWENNIFKPNEVLKKILVDAAPDMFTSIMAGVAQQTMQMMQQNMPVRY